MKGNDSVYFRQQSERQTDNEKGPQGIASCWLSFPSLKCFRFRIFLDFEIFVQILQSENSVSQILQRQVSEHFRLGINIYLDCVKAETQLWTQNQLRTDFRVESQRQSLQKSRSRQKPVFVKGQKTAQWAKKTRGPTDCYQKLNCYLLTHKKLNGMMQR